MTAQAAPVDECKKKSRLNRVAFEHLLALRRGVPDHVQLMDGRVCTLVHLFKHDSFAATGLYRLPTGEEVVVKLGRTQNLFGVPMRWLGRYLSLHEVAAYRLLADQPGVPALTGVVVGQVGFAHAYVPGRPLQKGDRPSPEFWVQLRQLLDVVHARQMAYVDLNKRQNILLGDDGRPYLIDFQISFGPVHPDRWPAVFGWLGGSIAMYLFEVFRAGDDYHFCKHKHRLTPELCTPEETLRATRQSAAIRWHRAIIKPLQKVRRAILDRVNKAAGEEKGPG